MREKSLLERNFSFIKTTIRNGILYCYGEFKPTEVSVNYKYRIKYNAKGSPKVVVKEPNIEYDDDIHMYPKTNNLCLFHKSDLVWDSSKHHIFELIVPWIHEWFVFYELHQINGKWLHPFVPHNNNKREL